MSILLSVFAIVACGFFGAVAGWSAMKAFGWTGTDAALLAALIGMVVATLGWIAGVALRNAFSHRRPGDDSGRAPRA